MIAERLRGPPPALRLGPSAGSSPETISQAAPVRRSPAPVTSLTSSSSSSQAPPPPRRPTVLHGRSCLNVSRTEYVLGTQEPLIVSWDIKEEISPSDWIGLYRTDETDPSHFLEYKNKRSSNTQKGQVTWIIETETLFTEDVTNVCFRYYHGSTGILRAVSPVVTVKRLNDAASSQIFMLEILRKECSLVLIPMLKYQFSQVKGKVFYYFLIMDKFVEQVLQNQLLILLGLDK
ncbi:E3 ubiquitin-protein ligase HECW2-like isoform X2 [Centruroides sculpturatus]|uniref:E3 ubiquitin-protein ligase HECW2-like isoform X2 n=1 Tax=Centruroides sculpturatus TaxID=218467 RepID=UPI000C6E5C57|nr:E3 ubiquitin-protein ligase HECW2-like isoform X2 [Centruroides sculpturatus]